MAFNSKVFSLSELSESAKERIALEIKKAVEKQVKKELAKRRKKFARKLIVMGITFTVGCVIYAFSDQIVDVATEKAFASAVNRSRQKKLDSGKKRR